MSEADQNKTLERCENTKEKRLGHVECQERSPFQSKEQRERQEDDPKKEKDDQRKQMKSKNAKRKDEIKRLMKMLERSLV